MASTLNTASTSHSSPPLNKAWPWLEHYALAIVLIPVLTVRILFIITYPLNRLGGDSMTYYKLMLTGDSSLVHAAGYPYLMRVIWSDARILELMRVDPLSFDKYILFTQHVIDIIAVVLLFFLVKRIFGTAAATIAALLYGLTPLALSTASSTFPESFQGNGLVFALWVGYHAYYSRNIWLKLLLYALLSTIFTWTFLVKFNALIAALFIYIVLLGLEFWNHDRWYPIAFATVIAAMMVINQNHYVTDYHEPSVGTEKLTYDESWVLIGSAVAGITPEPTLSPDNGIYTKRWLAFSRVLPTNYGNAGPGMFSHVDAIPEEIRAPYREDYLYILEADHAELDKILEEQPLPEDFNLHLSSIPISYFIGLEESDELGWQVYRESLLAYPTETVQYILNTYWHSLFLTSPNYLMYPIFPNEIDYIDQENLSRWGFTTYTYETDTPNQERFYYEAPELWLPGVRFFSVYTNLWRLFPDGLPIFLIALTLMGMLYNSLTTRQLNREMFVVLFALLIMGAIIGASSLLATYRWKELRFLLPLTTMLTATSVVYVVSRVYHFIAVRIENGQIRFTPKFGLVTAGVLILLLLLGEGVARLLVSRDDMFGPNVAHSGSLGWQMAPNLDEETFTTNSLGLRDTLEPTALSPENIVIAVQGDEQVAALHFETEDTLVHHLKQATDRIGCGTQCYVLNFGVNEYDLNQYVLQLAELRYPYSVDIAIMVFNSENDFASILSAPYSKPRPYFVLSEAGSLELISLPSNPYLVTRHSTFIQRYESYNYLLAPLDTDIHTVDPSSIWSYSYLYRRFASQYPRLDSWVGDQSFITEQQQAYFYSPYGGTWQFVSPTPEPYAQYEATLLSLLRMWEQQSPSSFVVFLPSKSQFCYQGRLEHFRLARALESPPPNFDLAMERMAALVEHTENLTLIDVTPYFDAYENNCALYEPDSHLLSAEGQALLAKIITQKISELYLLDR